MEGTLGVCSVDSCCSQEEDLARLQKGLEAFEAGVQSGLALP